MSQRSKFIAALLAAPLVFGLAACATPAAGEGGGRARS